MKKLALAVFLGLSSVATLSGCATTQVQQTQQRTSAKINASQDKVWSMLIQGFAEQGVPFKIVEKDSGLIVTEDFKFTVQQIGYGNKYMGRYIYAPKGFLAVWDGLKANLTVSLSPAGESQTNVRIKANYAAYESNVSKSWVPAQSTGSLESAMLDRLEVQLAEAP